MKKLLSIALLTGSLIFSGCGSSENFVFTNTNVGNAPICQDDTYATNEDTALTVNAANGVLANDTPNGGTVTFAATSTGNGTITGSADGAFVYTPLNGFTGEDTFSYTVSNSAGESTCTVTVTVVAVNGFFVDAANGNDATGSFQGGNPFQTIQAAVTAAGANQDIIVRPGTYNENVTLLDGQRLLGSGSVLAQGSIPRPVINGGGLTLADDNTISYLRIQQSPASAVEGTDITDLTITDCQIDTTTGVGSGIIVTGADGNISISSNTVTGAMGVGIILLGGTGDVMTATVINNSLTGNQTGSIGITFSQTGIARAQIIGNIMTGSTVMGGTFEAATDNSAEMCLDIEGNTNDDVYCFERLDNAAPLEVEQLSQLTSINSGSATVQNGLAFFPATEVGEDGCEF